MSQKTENLNRRTPFTAVVLAGDRTPDDPVARAAKVPCKALTPVGGTPMVLRVLQTLGASREIGCCLLCGPPQSAVEQSAELQAGIAEGQFRWISNQATPSSSAHAAMQTLPEMSPILLTTADHALLSVAMVDYFCTHARSSGCDVVIAVVAQDVIAAAYPEMQRTMVRLRENAYSGCNLFAFQTPHARSAAKFWRQVETQRKKPLRVVVGALGWMAVLRYFLGWLSLNEALERLSKRIGVKVGAVIMPFAEAAIDVDKVSDWTFAQRIVSRRERVDVAADFPQGSR